MTISPALTAQAEAAALPASIEGDVGMKAPMRGLQTFAFGDPEPVLGRNGLNTGLECWSNGRWYDTPLPMESLTRSMNASAHHASALTFKVNQICKYFMPHPLLSRETFRGLVLDYLALGNYYAERIDNTFGHALALKRSLAKYTRRGVAPGAFFAIRSSSFSGIGQEHAFAPGSVYQGMAPTLDQEIYGVPEYLCAISSLLLNEAAGVFRRRYYLNGAHSGFIMYVTAPELSDDDAEAIEAALKGSKGVGNFSSMLLHLPGAAKDSLQLLHPSEVGSRDEFLNVKGVSRDDILAAHRVPPQLLGVVPQNAGGFGDVDKAEDAFYWNEIVPLQTQFFGLNDFMGQEVVRFAPREDRSGPAA